MEIDNGYYRNLMDSLYDGVYCVNLDKKIIFWNKGAERITGYKSSEVMGRDCSDKIFLHITDKDIASSKDLCLISRALADGRRHETEVYFLHKDGHRFPVLVHVVPITDTNNRITGAAEIFRDNTPAISVSQRIEELEKMALLDSLTMLVNKGCIEMNLHGRLDALFRYGWAFGLLFIYIDKPKKSSSTFWHDIKDKVLKTAAKTLLFNSRTSDIIGRWKGEEFIAIIVNTSEEQLYTAAERFRFLVEQSSFSAGTDTIKATISIGATLAQKTDTVELLLKRAKRLMDQSRLAGGNRTSMKTA
ncbi:MAG: PAS domain-containing protein [Nitrospirota bacterium]